uniref:Large ribosomal subunit protein eL14 n=1 Tax=Timema californicum TaxID=61474 RepID=A0A7R9PD48_TIMCA|nr:unnamed protein product [Timema californicum]
MPFSRFVETGRVAYISDGPNKGKLCTIVDVIDQTRALIDGPNSGVPRGQIRLNQLHLTKLCIKFPYTGATRVVRKAWNTGKVDEKWEKTLWSRKLESNKRRRELTDFDRFKLRRARQTRNKIRTLAYRVLKRKATKAGTLYGKKKVKKVKKDKKEKKDKKDKKEKTTPAASKPKK